MAAEVINLVSSSEDEVSPKKAAKTALAIFQPRKDKPKVNASGKGTEDGAPKPLRPLANHAPRTETTNGHASHHTAEPKAKDVSLVTLMKIASTSALNSRTSPPSRTSSTSRANRARRTIGAEQEEKKRKFKEFHQKEAARKQQAAQKERDVLGQRQTQSFAGVGAATGPLPKRTHSPQSDDPLRATKRARQGEEDSYARQQGLEQARRLSAAAIQAGSSRLESGRSGFKGTSPTNLSRRQSADEHATQPGSAPNSKSTDRTEYGMHAAAASKSVSHPVVSSSKLPTPTAIGSGNFGSRYTAEEDARLVQLKEQIRITWSDMPNHFQGRTQGSLQVRYSTLKQRARGGPRVERRITEDRLALEDAFPARRRHKVAKTDGFISWADVKAKGLDEADDFDAGRVRIPVKVKNPIQVVNSQAQDTMHPSSTLRILRSRELGGRGERAWSGPWRHAPDTLHNHVFDTIGPRRSFHGMSRDVNSVAWAPDGNTFAAGAIAISDETSMQYNRPNNLLLGNVKANSLRELPEHHVPRPVVQDAHNVNALPEMRETQDPRLFKTVAAVCFSGCGDRLFSGGEDHKLRMYDVNAAKCLSTQDLGARVDLLSVSEEDLVATASHRRHLPVTVSRCRSRRFSAKIQFGTSTDDNAMALFPTSLKWGSGVYRDFLLCGYGSDAFEDDNTTAGAIGLYNVETGKSVQFGNTPRNVFDVAWNPLPSSSASNFAVASAKAGKKIRSVIQCFATNQDGPRSVLEWECPALDINDVVYCPHDDNLIAAGATNGKVYVWDKRFADRGQRPLHVLAHDSTKNVLDPERELEQVDTGVRFLSWGATSNRLYSGSSDGMVKVWNPYRTSEDALVKNVATFNSAVMSGAFSPDYRDLLIGEDQGQLNMLSIDREGRSVRAAKKFDLYPAPPPPLTDAASTVSSAQEMLQLGEIEYKPMGALKMRQAVQGPTYSGPFLAPSENFLDQLDQEHKAACKSRDDLRLMAPPLNDDEHAALQRELQTEGGRIANVQNLLRKAVKRQHDAWLLHPAAEQLQRDFYNARKTQRRLDNSEHQSLERCQLDCNYLPAAGDDAGEAPDTRQSEQRIPGALRSASTAPIDVSDLTNTEILDLQFTSKCAACMGPAKKPKRGLPLCPKCSLTRAGLTARCGRCSGPIRPDTTGKANKLCQRCDFCCFRCGHSADVGVDGRITCHHCQKSWKAGVLGYELLGNDNSVAHMQEVNRMDEHDDSDEEMGHDEMERLAARWHIPLIDGFAGVRLY